MTDTETVFVFAVHYHRSTGIIRNWGTDDGSTESFAPDHLIARFERWHVIDPQRQRIDVATRGIIDKSRDERATDLLPIIKQAIAGELAATDTFMVPDRPMDAVRRDDWRHYRQTLRELAGDTETILAAWPVRPDGLDAAATFRDQLKE